MVTYTGLDIRIVSAPPRPTSDMLFLSAQALGLAALAVDPAHVAVYDPCAAREDVQAALIDEGVVSVEPWAISGWWLCELPPIARTPRESTAALDRIARSGRVEFVSPVHTGLDGGPAFPTTDLLVRFERGTDEQVEHEVLRGLSQFEIVEEHFGAMDDAYRLRTTSRDARDVLAASVALSRRSDVLFAEPDCIFTGRGSVQATVPLPPNDPAFPNTWWLANTGQGGGTPGVDVDALSAWPRSIGSASVVIAVIDVGVESTHPDLAANVISGADLTSNGPGNGDPVNAFDNHGTPVAGCAVAAIGNAIGACGIVPGCHVVSLRTFITTAADGTWTSQFSWTVNALAQAASKGARVTNNSNFYGLASAAVDQKYLDLRNAGIVHFASAGNAGVNAIDYPASSPSVNAVGAITRTGSRWPSSNTGPELAFVAPGETIYTTDRQGAAGWNTMGDFTNATGTSFATPMAAGVAALLLSVDSTLTPAQIETTMRSSCIDAGPIGFDTQYGFGRVSAVRALDQLCQAPFSFCSTSPNSVGPGASITAQGVPTAMLPALDLIVTGCPPNGFGVFFVGDASVQIPFGNGFRCAGGSVYRSAVVTTTAFGDAQLAPDWINLPSPFQVVPGDVRYAQFWYRDAMAGGAPFNLSDGVEIHFCR